METKVSAGSSRRSQQQQEIVPAAVEAVLLVGSYPKDLVLSTYHHLTTASPTRVDRPGTEGASAGAPEPVTAQALMTAMLEQAKASHSHSSPSGASWLTDEVERREGGADDEVEEDGAGDEPGRPSSSGRPLPPGTTPGHREATADSNHSVAVTTEAGTDPSSSSTTTAGPSTGAAATGQHTVPTGAEAPTETSSTCTATSASGNDATSASGNDATSASGNDATSAPTPAVSGQPVVPLVFSTPENESAPPQQPHESQWPADTSFTFSTPPEGSSLAEERAKDRKRLLTRLRGLRAENERLKARQLCRHCRQKPTELTFLPCGHFIFCQTCGSSFTTCPSCRKTILADVRTFLS